MKFIVTIEETLAKQVEVKANSLAEAEKMVRDEYYKGNHVLDADNFTSVAFYTEEKEND